MKKRLILDEGDPEALFPIPLKSDFERSGCG